MNNNEYLKLSHVDLFNLMVHIREKFDFFELLCKYGVLDTSNSYIQELMKVSNKFFVLHCKKHNDDVDFFQMVNLGEKFDLILYEFYMDLHVNDFIRKEN